MTLITIIAPRADALVVAGDNRLLDVQYVDGQVKYTPHDDFTKIVKIASNGFGTACGTARQLHPVTRAVEFDAFALISEFFEAKDLTKQTASDFARFVEDRFDSYLQTYNREITASEEQYLFAIVLGAVADDGVVLYQLRFFEIPGNGIRLKSNVPSQTYNRKDPQRAVLTSGGLRVFGDPEVTRALEGKGSQKIQQIEEHGRIHIRLTQPDACPFDTLCDQQAVDMCIKVIAIASENAEALSGKPSISRECDAAIIERTHFRWMHGPHAKPSK